MPSCQEAFTIGVEEEYQIIDPISRQLSPSALSILPKVEPSLSSYVQPELRLSQIEITTPICHTLYEVRKALRLLRLAVNLASAQEGKRIASGGTHPFSHWKEQPVTPKPRYQGLTHDYQQLTREQAIFGCHVHIGLKERESAIQVMNQMRVWLAALLALTASSPFWLGEDTGYASFRTEIWSRWPTAGPPMFFTSLQEHTALARALVATGSIDDTSKIYWDMRLSARFETVEVRVMDACTTIDEAVMISGLIRALVRTCYYHARDRIPFDTVRPELLRMAHWRAARYGLSESLIDVEAQQLIPAPRLIERLLAFVEPALRAEGDWSEVSSLVDLALRQGDSAARQRQVYTRTGRMEDVVDFLAAETAQDISAIRD